MKKLLDIEFQKAGCWLLKDGQPRFKLEFAAKEKNLVYAFATKGDVFYIGKTTNTLKNRMSGYQAPGPTQQTNLRVHNELLRKILEGAEIGIYVLLDNKKFKFHHFEISLAAGVEDSLIRHFEPKWNFHGKKRIVEQPESTPQTFNEMESMQQEPMVVCKTEQGMTENYLKSPFFNVRTDCASHFSVDDMAVSVELVGRKTEAIVGKVDLRNARPMARIHGYTKYIEWVKANFKPGDTMVIEILRPLSIRLSKKAK